MDALVGRADAVDAPETLDDADRVPVNVVVDQVVAVLEVLGFADTVGGDQQVEFAFAGKFVWPLLGSGRERGEDAAQVLAQVGQCGLVAAGAGDKGGVQTQFLQRPGVNFVVQIQSDPAPRSDGAEDPGRSVRGARPVRRRRADGPRGAGRCPCDRRGVPGRQHRENAEGLRTAAGPEAGALAATQRQRF